MEILLTRATNYKKSNDKTEAKKQKGKLENKVIELNRQVESQNKRKRQLEFQVKKLEEQIFNREKEIEELDTEIIRKQDTADNYKKEIADLKAEYNSEVSKMDEKDSEISDAKVKEWQAKANTMYKQFEKERTRTEALKEENERLKTMLQEYKATDSFFLDNIKKTYHARYNRGKAITLRKEKITEIFDCYIKQQNEGKRPTSYSIGKETNVAHTTVKNLLNENFTNVFSLRKIVSALHSLNGNWSAGNKAIIERYIRDYENKLAIAEAKEKEQKEDIELNIKSLPEAMKKYKEKSEN